jgi:hypothetical protein
MLILNEDNKEINLKIVEIFLKNPKTENNSTKVRVKKDLSFSRKRSYDTHNCC